LNRQFLFRKSHIGKSKSLIACEEVKKINPEFNCESLQIEVREETEDIFDENFYKKQNFVLIAVDNVKARNYINNQCIFHRVKLIECGTLGENASSQLIIPLVSEEYKGVESGKNEFGMCTIRNLPSLIEHCIEWSKDKFYEYFGKNIRLLKNFIENPNEFFKNNEGNELYEKLIYIKNYLIIFKSKSYDQCLNFAKKIFYLNYQKLINDTLIINPPDKILENGTKFWKGSNRLPHVLEYNPDDETNFYYIEYFAYLLADSLNIPYNNDINYKKEFLKLSEISLNDELYSDITHQDSLEEEINRVEKLKSELLRLHSEEISKEKLDKIHEQLFEKDHDENHQVDFIYISSNLRASNFNIEFCTRDKVKFISGNIIPSIPTTTSSIVGFISSQIYTLLQTTNIDYLRQINIDLSTPFFLIYRPKKPYKNKDYTNPATQILYKAIPHDFTCWDFIEIEGNKTLQELLDYINEKYNIEITGLYSLNSVNLWGDDTKIDFFSNYMDSIGITKTDRKENSTRRNIYFKIQADEKDNEDIHIQMPKFKYISK
jgi:ubiquitin-activating enzyme E1